jgi:hypothetical protein
MNGRRFRSLIAIASLAGVLLLPSIATAGLKPCHPTTNNHERWSVKTRSTPHAPISPITITVAKLIAMTVPSVTGTPNHVLTGTPEENVYSLNAYVMLIKRSPDDCDIHLEVSDTPDPKAPRVIVEIPPTLPAEQQHVVAFLGLTDVSTNGKTFTVTTAVRLHFVGDGFFDLSHAATSGVKEGQGHGSYTTKTTGGVAKRVYNVRTILELHPVFGVGKQ